MAEIGQKVKVGGVDHTVKWVGPDHAELKNLSTGEVVLVKKRTSQWQSVFGNAFANGRAKAEAYLNSRMESVGVKVENISKFVVEGEEFYGGTVFDAVQQWCRANRKSEAKVTYPPQVSGTYEMTVGGKAVKK